MKRLLLVPKRLHPNRYDFLNVKGEKCLDIHCLYKMIQDRLGFKIIYTDTVGNFPKETEIVLCVYRRPMSFLDDISPNVKFMITLGDVHSWHKDWLSDKKKVLDRADVIVNQTNDAFRKTFPQYVHKYHFLPQFFRTHERYASLDYNRSPKMKCLLTGRVNHEAYKLRTQLWKKVANNEDGGKWREKIDVMKHYWYERGRKRIYSWEIPPVVGDDYAKRLNEYFCCTSLPGIASYMIGKCVEIPAAGSLLVTNEVPDMKTAGFVPWKHFVPITKQTLLSQIEDCLTHPEKYEKIRRKGMEFVRANHSVNNRFEQFKKILDGL